MDFNEYKSSSDKPSLKGLVLYETVDKEPFNEYKIYGTDEDGNLITDDKGQLFFLSNN